MVKIDWSLAIQIINFLFLIWIMNIVLYKPIRNMLLKRKSEVDGLNKNIDGLSIEAGAKNKEYDDGIRGARAEGMKRRDALVQDASTEEKGIIARINEDAQAEMAKVREQIAQDAEKVKTSLLKEVDMFANEIGKKILGRTV